MPVAAELREWVMAAVKRPSVEGSSLEEASSLTPEAGALLILEEAYSLTREAGALLTLEEAS